MREVLPLANRLDPVKGDIPPSLFQQLAEMGYFGITIPEEYGVWGSVPSSTAWSLKSWRAAG
jgi:alkylation response protein AidB-like acyl-CoA dehydrogenase